MRLTTNNIYLCDGVDMAHRVNFANHFPGVINLLDWEDLISAIGFVRDDRHPLHVEVIPDEANDMITFRVAAVLENVLVESVLSLGMAIMSAFLYNQIENGFPVPRKDLTPNIEFHSPATYLDPNYQMTGIDDTTLVSSLQEGFTLPGDDESED